MFAGSCIGVVLLVLCLEFLRRVGREYDAFILRRARLRRTYLSESALAASVQPDSNNKNYQSIDTIEDGGSKTTDCDCSRNIPASPAEDDPIAPAPVPSEHSSTTQKNPTTSNTAKAEPSHTPVTKPACADLAAFAPYRPSPVEQIVRALLHMLQFAVAYFIMLLAMYFNGYIIICIFIGAFLGSLIFSWEPVSLNKE